MFYRLAFLVLSLSIFSESTPSSTFSREAFPSALEMSSEKLHRVVSIVRDPLPVADTMSVPLNNVIADISTSGDGTVYIRCSQVSKTVSPFFMDASVDFLGLRGTVHSGVASLIRASIADFQRALTAFVGRVEIERPEFIFTGYSTGASVASLLALHFVNVHRSYGVQELRHNQVKIIGFETQPIGNRGFVDDFLTIIPSQNILNFWHADDFFRYNIFYSKEWTSSEKRHLDLGTVLISPGKDVFVASSPPSMFSKTAKFLKYASFAALLYMAYKGPEYGAYKLEEIKDMVDDVAQKLLKHGNEYAKEQVEYGLYTISESVRSLIDSVKSYKSYVSGAFAVGVFGFVGEFFTCQPKMSFMFDSSLMSQTIKKYNHSNGYFVLPARNL